VGIGNSVLHRVKIKDLACDRSSLSSVLPWLERGWFETGVHKDMSEQEKDGWKKRQVS